MTHHVQEFIESTIDLIEKQEYHEVFTIWYLHYTNGKFSSKDSENLEELFKVFESAGIDLYNESEDARKDIIAEHMYDYVDDVLNNDPDAYEITLPDVLRQLNSRLSISPIELNNIFKNTARKISKTHNIIILPFKIRKNNKL